MSDHPRAIWINENDCQRLYKIALLLEDQGGLLGNPDPSFIRSLAEQYREAPEDAVSTVAGVMISFDRGNSGSNRERRSAEALIILRSVGMP